MFRRRKIYYKLCKMLSTTTITTTNNNNKCLQLGETALYRDVFPPKLIIHWWSGRGLVDKSREIIALGRTSIPWCSEVLGLSSLLSLCLVVDVVHHSPLGDQTEETLNWHLSFWAHKPAFSNRDRTSPNHSRCSPWSAPAIRMSSIYTITPGRPWSNLYVALEKAGAELTPNGSFV